MANDIYEHRARIVKALAHPLRLKLIELLSQKNEWCVCELVEALKCDQPAVSKHLNMLKNTGLIVSHKEGNKVLYQLRMPCITNFLNCIDHVLKDNLAAQQQELAVFNSISPGTP